MAKSDLENAVGQLHVVEFEAGDTITTQGDHADTFFVIDRGECIVEVDGQQVSKMSAGRSFGENALLRDSSRAATIKAVCRVKCLTMTRQAFTDLIKERERRECMVRGAKIFETFTDDQIAKLAGILERERFGAGEYIINKGELGQHLYILESGGAVALIPQPDGSEQPVKQYAPGEIFGEKALLERAPRYASVRTEAPSTCLKLSRQDFEQNLGPLSQLRAEAYLSDPRKMIADFYARGTKFGPAQSSVLRTGQPVQQYFAQNPSDTPSRWFAVYRPCSRDSIAKMLGRVGVGKGLNVKGKSAKKGRLSGFVPFVQISDNSHKKMIEDSSPNARTNIYYRSAASYHQALEIMQKTLNILIKKDPTCIQDPVIHPLTKYCDKGSHGLNVPEKVIREIYIMQPDLSPVIGWETGRSSEPAFMDMNLHSTRECSSPSVCVLQWDISDPLNPAGLLVAYAEQKVSPVVSDFDTFTVGSHGSYEYKEPIPDAHADLIRWSLKQCEAILSKHTQGDFHVNWTKEWLGILTKEMQEGFMPQIPPLGFGDSSSIELVRDIVHQTSDCGAIRHGAECFNYYFPQELDEEFLVVWDGFEAKYGAPWLNHSESELRRFLLDRITDGYLFPINPVWAVRDKGWYEVFLALRKAANADSVLPVWYPGNLIALVDRLHTAYPNGLTKKTATSEDLTGDETLNVGLHATKKAAKSAWKKLHICDRTGQDMTVKQARTVHRCEKREKDEESAQKDRRYE